MVAAAALIYAAALLRFAAPTSGRVAKVSSPLPVVQVPTARRSGVRIHVSSAPVLRYEPGLDYQRARLIPAGAGDPRGTNGADRCIISVAKTNCADAFDPEAVCEDIKVFLEEIDQLMG